MRISVIGNAGGGKTTLSRRLGEIHKITVTHVDSIQFIPGMKIRNLDETRQILTKITEQQNWLIDGFGPLDIIEKRFILSDHVIFIDFPIWRHFWWCTKRQIKSLWSRRSELPEGCNEASLTHTIKLFKTLWRSHVQMRPELIRLLRKEDLQSKVIFVTTMKQWRELFEIGLNF